MLELVQRDGGPPLLVMLTRLIQYPKFSVQAWLHVTLPLKMLSWLTTLMLLCNLMALLIRRLHMLIMMDGLAISDNDVYPRLTPSAWTATIYSIYFFFLFFSFRLETISASSIILVMSIYMERGLAASHEGYRSVETPHTMGMREPQILIHAITIVYCSTRMR